MKHLLAVTAVLQPVVFLTLASQHSFSVNDDLLAFPQYEVHFKNDYIHNEDAEEKLREQLALKFGSKQELGKVKIGHSKESGHVARDEKDVAVTYERMVLDGHDFLCSIPEATPPTSQGEQRNETLAKAEKEKELARAVDRGWELLSGMDNHCMFYMEGWWSYRFCYGKGVKQFHQLPASKGAPSYPPVEDPSVPGYELGIYRTGNAEADDAQETGLDTTQTGRGSGSTARGELVERGESRYLVQQLGGGTLCDLTLKDRSIEVQFHCNPQSTDRITFMKEMATCAYLMIIHTPRLCNDVAFLPPQKDQPNTIECHPVLQEDEIENYEEDLEHTKAAEKKERIKTASSEIAAILGLTDRPKQKHFIGDIEVGGYNRIPEDKTLESGAIVGGGKETFVETLATSEGWQLSEEEIKRLKLGKIEVIKKFEKHVKEHAAGKKWKVDVVDTPRGRELRAIIGDESEDENTPSRAGKKQDEQGNQGSVGDSQKRGKGKEKEEEEGEGSKEEFYRQEL